MAPHMPEGVTHVISGLLLLAGLAGMFLIALLNRPIEVSVEDCMRFWNGKQDVSDVVPFDRVVTIAAEDEQDLGYGLCYLQWQDDDGTCNVFRIGVTSDTKSWDGAEFSSCDLPIVGTVVQPNADGTLDIAE